MHMSTRNKSGLTTFRGSAWGTPRIGDDTTSDDEENNHVKGRIPGDYENHTMEFINSATNKMHEQIHISKAKQPKGWIHHHLAHPEIASISSTPGAWLEEASSPSEEKEIVKELEDTVEVSGAVARRPSPGPVQHSCSEPRASHKPSTTPKSTHFLRSTVGYASNEPIKLHPTSPTVEAEYSYQSLKIEYYTTEVSSDSNTDKRPARITGSRLTLTLEEFVVHCSPEYESDSGSDSERASIFSEDSPYDTPDEIDSDRPSKESTGRPQSHVQDEPKKASTNGTRVTGKCEACVACGGGWRAILSEGPKEARRFFLQPSKNCKYDFDLSNLPKAKPRPYNSRSPEVPVRVFGVAFKDSDAGPEVMNVGNKKKPPIYVGFLWDDGAETWENGETARWLVGRMTKRGLIETKLTPHEYLYSETVKAWRRTGEFLKANPEWCHGDDE